MADVATPRRWTPTGWLSRFVGTHVSRAVGIVVFGAVVLMCIFVPLLSPYDPNDFVNMAFMPPSWAHPFGTDAVGRDIFVRTFAGGRVDLIAAAFTTGFALIVGTVLGTLAGASTTRVVDTILMRIVDAVLAFPLVILLLVLMVVIGTDRAWGPAPAGLVPAIVSLMCVQWAIYARLARGQALVLRDADFAVASRLAGLPASTVLLRHIAPGVGRITAAYAIGDVVLVVVILASLPFLGAGVQPPAAEWGAIMYEGRGFLRNAWWITVLPGAVLAVTGLALSFIADSLLDSREVRT